MAGRTGGKQPHAVKNKDLLLRCLKLFHFGVSLALCVLVWNGYLSGNAPAVPESAAYLICALYVCLKYFFCRVYNAYLIGYTRKPDIVLSLSLADIFSAGIVYAILLITRQPVPRPGCFALLQIMQIAFNVLWTALADRIYFRLYAQEDALIVYGSRHDLIRLLEIGCFEKRFRAGRLLEDPKSFQEIADALGDYGTVFLIGVSADIRNRAAQYCAENRIAGYFLPQIGDVIAMGGHHARSFGMPLMSIQRTKEYPEVRAFKRLADILFSIPAILITGPLMLLIALAVHLQDGGPVLYRQLRLTRDGKEFTILKFRSMVTDAEKDGTARLSDGEGDERVTPVGRIIRAIRADELPQLFNILLGDMSFVGPRPERPEITDRYSEIIPAFRLRLQVKAGLTGYAQVYGKYNTDPYDKLLMDLIYINRRSFLMDLQLIFATVRILFSRESTAGIREGTLTALSPDGGHSGENAEDDAGVRS